MRIAVISSSFPRFRGDGAGSFIYSLARSLVRLGHDVTVLAPHDPAVVRDWQSDVVVRHVHFIWPGSWSRLGYAQSLASDVHLKWHAYPLVALFSFFSTVQLWAEIRRHGADVIHAQWLIPGGFIGAVVSRLTGVPLVVSVHGSDVFVAERHRLFRPVTRFILRPACHVIACSGDLARRVVALGMPPQHVKVIPYGVDIEQYEPDPQLARTLRARLPVSGDQNVVMAMGRLVHKKGFSYLLRAAQPVLTQYPNTTFVLAGEGDLRAELEELAQSLDIRQQVLFTGHIPWDQTPGYLAMADVLVVPSVLDDAGNIDGLPNVLLESMASGCAIVASNVAGIPEVILDGENGLLVPQRDERALAEAICQLLRDPQLRQRLGHSARSKVEEMLDWQQIGERVVQALQACAEESL